ncbi:50S ribosomal protein L13 [Candidatus Woesebacteria bacterium CG_4_10_14_0_2_um_filter_39_14]|uniref:Large ribosomal subunit protein uL13 n=3 Tax=Microgenomates group TaxID=1794810 RepID=A0A2M6YPP1_9BACT|nr:MAG: 50S ribosomal protein L13 [Candidatus Shapirobacteria bacterium CG07_land_8_20_14_0_80_39_12]PIZ49080.1 MAG: 50S ribosomal protein L13 [Candidatus Woesebacteria bacterium CG_4_10_14_0_2_um_filter_39_14]PJA49241.1 MAG: 50S ribosomal protein L13 [Candidatus Shapirobacteria bacterium CG_4_9_14_3_um_filter_39_13]
MTFKTRVTKAKEIKREWHLINAQDQILGRMAVEIAALLMGKNKPSFVPYLDGGDYVVVINAAKVKVSGRKAENKLYYRHSGYPGGFKKVTFAQQMAKDPTQIIRHAVEGMLPKNKLRDQRLARLKVFIDEKHNYEDKFKK